MAAKFAITYAIWSYTEEFEFSEFTEHFIHLKFHPEVQSQPCMPYQSTFTAF